MGLGIAHSPAEAAVVKSPLILALAIVTSAARLAISRASVPRVAEISVLTVRRKDISPENAHSHAVPHAAAVEVVVAAASQNEAP